jgi:hypothetical protein
MEGRKKTIKKKHVAVARHIRSAGVVQYTDGVFVSAVRKPSFNY